MTIEERAYKKYPCRSITDPVRGTYQRIFRYIYIQGATDQQEIDIEKACKWLNKNLSRCIECYVDDKVTTRLKEDVLYDFKKAMEEQQ